MTQYNIDIDKNVRNMALDIVERLLKINTFNDNKVLQMPIFLCVGNSNIVADMLGPLVGERLKDKYGDIVYGTLDNNVKASNLKNVWKAIKSKYPCNPVVIVDSMTSDESQLGYVNFLPYGCIPAVRVNNKIMGNISILGNTSTTGFSDLMFLKCTRYSMIKNMSEKIAKSIYLAMEIYKSCKSNTYAKVASVSLF